MVRGGERPLQKGAATQSLPFLPSAARWQSSGEDSPDSHAGGATGSKASPSTNGSSPQLARRLSAALSLPHLARREDALNVTRPIWGSSQNAGGGKLPYLRPDQVESDTASQDDDKFRRSRTNSVWNFQGAPSARGRPQAPPATTRRSLLGSSQPLSPGRGPAGSRRSLLDRARCSKGFTRPAYVRSIGVLDRKASQQAALDRDKKYVQQQLALHAQEPASPQEGATKERWWNATFAPIPEPQQYLPTIYKALAMPVPSASSSEQCVAPAAPASATAQRPSEDKNPVFLVEELEELIRVCRLFQALVAPKAPEGTPAALAERAVGLAATAAGGGIASALSLTTGPPVLQRSSFCRLVCAMEGLSAGSGGPTRLGSAVAHFDRLASRIVVRGSSSPGGTVFGFLLSVNTGTLPPPQLTDLPISALFSGLLRDMAADLGSGMKERPNTGEGLLALSAAKSRLMDVLLPQAARYAEDRAKLLQRYNKQRKYRRASVSSPSLADSKVLDEALKQIVGTSEPWQSKSSLPSKEPPGEAQSKSPLGNASKARRSSNLSATASAPRASMPQASIEGGEASGGNSLSASQALNLNFVDRESASGHSSPRESCCSEEDEFWHLQEWEDVDDDGGRSEREEEDQAAKTIYRHTFAVLKGELLSSQLLEPEVMHFIAQFSDLFRTFFDAYADVPVSATEGHMTLMAFLRFCNDFDLFPDMVDFQTVQWLYNTAEGCGYVSPEAMLKRGTIDPKDGPLGSPTRGSVASSPDASKRGSLLREAASTMAKKRKSIVKSQQQQEDGILFCGKWLKSNLAWLTKDPGGMTADEATMTATLWAMDEWLQDMRMQVQEVCSFLSPPGTNTMTAEDFRVLVDFMQLEDPPSPGDIRRLAAALAPQPPPSGQEKPMVDIGMFQMAITAVGKLKERRNRAANCFMKDFSKMSRLESNALVFFRELWHTIEYKKITPEELFREFDEDSNGTLSPEELTTQIRQVLKFTPQPSAALTIEGPFDMLDLDSDGRISLEEFVSVMNKVKQAREMRKLQEEEKHPIFLSAKVARSSLPRRTFFGHRAFAECLVKIALEHMGYHGSPGQAEQPSFAKALWLLLYLHWKFECAVERVSDQQHRLERLPTSSLSGRHCPVYQSPLKKLVVYHLELFQDAPTMPPPAELCPAWAPPRDPCSVCNTSAVRGWGKPTCPHCSQADAVLAACWSRGRPTARGQRSLDGMILAVETASGL